MREFPEIEANDKNLKRKVFYGQAPVLMRCVAVAAPALHDARTATSRLHFADH